jgi:hypothetical protein
LLFPNKSKAKKVYFARSITIELMENSLQISSSLKVWQTQKLPFEPLSFRSLLAKGSLFSLSLAGTLFLNLIPVSATELNFINPTSTDRLNPIDSWFTLAQTTNSRIVATVSMNDIETFLRSTSILYRRESPRVIRFDVASYKMYGLLMNCSQESSGSGCTSILLRSRFKLSGNPSLNLVNEWNRTKLNSRAYIDTDGTIVIESDIQFLGGVSADYLRLNCALFILQVEMFAKHLGL